MNDVKVPGKDEMLGICRFTGFSTRGVPVFCTDGRGWKAKTNKKRCELCMCNKGDIYLIWLIKGVLAIRVKKYSDEEVKALERMGFSGQISELRSMLEKDDGFSSPQEQE